MRFGQFITSTGIPHDLEVGYNEKLFKQMVDFITGLNPDQLTEDQKSRIVDIISTFNLQSKEQYKVTNYDKVYRW